MRWGRGCTALEQQNLLLCSCYSSYFLTNSNFTAKNENTTLANPIILQLAFRYTGDEGD